MNYLDRKRSILLRPERKRREEGFCFIAGVDEVGRGPLAGPVVAAAVVLPDRGKIPAVADSKSLTPAEREDLDAALRNMRGIRIGIGEMSAEEIDAHDILRCTHAAMRKALQALEVEVDFILVDGRSVPGLPAPSEAIVKGDAKCASIAAASIVAKVYRDRMMREYDLLYPGYGFAENMGYGTAAHLAAIRKLGVCPIHRRSFAPVREYLSEFEQGELF